MKFLKFLPLLLSVVLFSSCGDDEPRKNTVALTIPSSQNTILSTAISGGQTEVLPGADYGLLADMDKNTVELYINSLQYTREENAISFTIPALPMTITRNGWKYNSSEAMTVEASNGSQITVSNLSVEFNLRADGSQNLVGLSYTIDRSYSVVTQFNYNQFTAVTSTTDITDPATDPFTTEQSMYLVVLDTKTKTCTVEIARPKFLQAMPDNLGNFVFENVPVTFTADGFSFQVNSIVPKIKNDPYPRFTLTDFKGKVVAGKTLTLEFDCAAFNRHAQISGTAY